MCYICFAFRPHCSHKGFANETFAKQRDSFSSVKISIQPSNFKIYLALSGIVSLTLFNDSAVRVKCWSETFSLRTDLFLQGDVSTTKQYITKKPLRMYVSEY